MVKPTPTFGKRGTVFWGTQSSSEQSQNKGSKNKITRLLTREERLPYSNYLNTDIYSYAVNKERVMLLHMQL